MKTILATAYAINPYKGSEDGMGWNFVCQIARFNKVIAITRENNQKHIDKYMNENPNPIYGNVTFLYYDTPYWMRFWKRGGRGALLYYWLWQRMIVRFVREKKLEFDITHNLNFHNDWTPSHLWKLGKPFVWGPIGHHPRIPEQYLQDYKNSYLLKDRAGWMVKKFFWNASLALKNTIKHANHTFCMNRSVSQVIPLRTGSFSIMPSVATEDFGYDPNPVFSKFTVLSAGRLVPLKGFDLTIKAFAKFIQKLDESERMKCELIIVGSGPEKKYYKDLVRNLHVEKYCNFISWIERSDLMDIYKRSSVFLFPSHEGAGMVVAEALSFGVPVVCLDNCGPGEFIDDTCGVAVKMQEYESTVNDLSDALTMLYQDKDAMERMRKNARARFESYFHWDRRGEQLNELYQKL